MVDLFQAVIEYGADLARVLVPAFSLYGAYHAARHVYEAHVKR